MTTNNHSLHPDEYKSWENLYNQLFTIDGKESLVQPDGTKQLVLLPMMVYTVISTMLQKLKYLPNSCFNRILIGRTPICGLRPVNRTSPSVMYKLTEILRTMMDGVRKQHILSITMIFYKKDDLKTIYDSYSLVFDYTIQLPEDQSQTSIEMLANVIHQIEYLFSWNDALPNDVELTFVVSALDQFKNQENQIPSPFHFLKENVKTVYMENETNHLMGRLTTLNGKIWLKFLPNAHPLSGSSISSEDLIIQTHRYSNKENLTDSGQEKPSKSPSQIIETKAVIPVITSPKLRKPTKRSTEPSKSGGTLPSLSSISSKSKKKTGFLSAVKSLITPSRTPAPVTSSTPNVADLVLIRHTSTPKPGETASRITIGGKEGVPALSAIYEASTPAARVSSPTPSTLTTTDISTASTPMIAVERRSTVRGQAAVARKKIAAMQIRDDDDDEEEEEEEDDNEQFKKLFSRQRRKKSKGTAVVPMKKSDNLSDVSTISSATSNVESLFTPPTGRKRPTTDRTGTDDLAAEHGTPPKTPRTAHRNRIDDQSSVPPTPMDTSDMIVNVDSPRLLRSVTKKLQQRASTKKQLTYEQETTKDEEETDRVYIQLERSSIALHYSMDESD